MNKSLLNSGNWQDYYTISDDEIQEMIFRDIDNTNPELYIKNIYTMHFLNVMHIHILMINVIQL